ncbi:hypothetical protein [Thalassotalea profundi]|uniref:MSHA biogenesis protein MshK n=1 Tax=Thalassotalea profundi TaxID=2036687 RepID=A0ABQ3J0Y8_9GAMM|nr:hypothetical protein [Thalassotalea profundi]GHE99095.1 hypothetical protein GCM10011501_30800 [Thalassotalea profundi]
MYKLITFVTTLVFMLTGQVVAQEVDPTRPLSGSSTVAYHHVKSTMQLQSIVDNGEHSTVIINGKVLKVGDRIEQYQLKQINKKNVVLSSPDKHLELSLFSPIVANQNEK